MKEVRQGKSLVRTRITDFKSTLGFPGGSIIKNLATSAGDIGPIPGRRKSPGEGNSIPIQHSCLGNPIDRGAWCIQSMGSQRVRHDSRTTTNNYNYKQLQIYSGGNDKQN